jgi:ferric-dicitrate binding protein FerR (iron transport regulator)
MTRSTIAIALSAAIMLSACTANSGSDTPASNAPAQAEAPRPVITGGWSAGTVSTDARAAAQFAVTAMNQPGVTLTSLDRVQQQVVAGINYRLDLTLSDGSRVRATVWKKLDGTFELTNFSPIISPAG